jgi:hypothetical protein
VSDLLALALSVRSGFSGERSELSELSPSRTPLSSHLSHLSHSQRAPSRRKRRWKWIPRIPCATCGLSPTDTYHDGSPRYDHGHDPLTGETWWAPRDAGVASVRRCPACRHEHPVGTTCRRCPECPSDLTPIARQVFVDLLADGPEAQASLARHNASLRLYARCDGFCGAPDCHKPYFDDAGLTRYRSEDQEI